MALFGARLGTVKLGRFGFGPLSAPPVFTYAINPKVAAIAVNKPDLLIAAKMLTLGMAAVDLQWTFVINSVPSFDITPVPKTFTLEIDESPSITLEVKNVYVI